MKKGEYSILESGPVPFFRSVRFKICAAALATSSVLLGLSQSVLWVMKHAQPWFAGQQSSPVLLFIQTVFILSGTGLVIWRVVDTTVIIPLEKIKKMICELNRENFNSRLRYHQPDEIGQVTEQFNRMAEHMEMIFVRLTVKIRTDQLTGLPNRQQILLDIAKANNPTLVLMNIDYFKELNDCYGNQTGDLILKEIANRLLLFQKTYQYFLYKMPADEYALFFNRDIDITFLEEMIKTLSDEINEKPFRIEDGLIQVRVTSGAAMGKDLSNKKSGGTWRSIATNADMALKKAKKNLQSYIIFSESLDIHKEYQNNIIWKQRLSEAMQNNRIVPFFQPIINNQTGKIEKYETLVRMIDPEDNIITPYYFLEVAKKAHIYGEITKTMLDQSFEVFADRPLEFSINLTVNDILDDAKNHYILNKVRSRPDIAKRVVFEILESEGIENYKDVMVFIEQMKQLGCKIAIDDFGSGYSNFDHILKLEVDYIKIDASLIRNIDIDKNAQIIVKTIVNFSKELGLKTISEHVHTLGVFQVSKDLGVDYSQGFYFGEPKKILSVDL